MIFMELNRSLVQTIEKIIRYHYHVSLLCTYVKFNKIPKGFRLRFYLNFIDCDYDNILKSCSRKHMHRTISYHKERLKQLEKSYKSLSQNIISEYPEKLYYVKSLLSMKHDKLDQDSVKRRHRKFLWDGMQVSYVKELCHEIKRKSLNVIRGNFNDSVEPQEHSHQTIMLTNDAPQIPPFLKDLCAKSPSFLPTPINYDWAQPQLDFDTFASRVKARYMFIHLAMVHQYLVHQKYHLRGEHLKQTLLIWKHFYQQLKRNYLLTSNEITLNIILLKMNEDL